MEEARSDEDRPESLAMNRNLSDIEMDNDDLDGDLNLSDDGGDQKRSMMRAQKQQKRATRAAKPQLKVAKKKQQVFRQEFDTNVFEVALGCLEHKGQIATGDPEFC